MSAIAENQRLAANTAQSAIQTRFDAEFGVYWTFMDPSDRPCITNELLDGLQGVVQALSSEGGWIVDGGKRQRVRYGVVASKIPGVFSLGGDLSLFRSSIRAKDRNALFVYGERCIDVLLAWHQNCRVEMTTLSLVQGEALGGGFEGALSATVLIAEESSRMGFPEVMFNLFPGMGAYSFLSRKIGQRAAERLIVGGSVHSARELYDMGVVDVITPDGTGETAVYSYIKGHARLGNGRRAFEQARNEVSGVTREEMMRVLSIWVDAALRLEERDLQMMDRLVRAQHRLNKHESTQQPSNVIPLQPVSAVKQG